ncbi:MAG: DmsE family decaheme c-type cytochrome [Acidobacteriota bacterium]
MLGAGLVCATALAAPAQGAKAPSPAAKADTSSQFVGSETCATCHSEVAKGFANNPHTKMVQMHGDNGITCENCHGPGKAHVEGGGDVSKIFNPAKATAKQVDETCLKCHAGTHPNFERSPHAKANVGCTSCHSIHNPDQQGAVRAALHMNNNIRAGSGDAKQYLLKAPQPTLCFQCHADQKSQFNMPFHHQVQEGLIACSDCHDPHGTFQNNNLRITADQNMVCVKCHTDVRGPFVYEHAPVKAEGCLACHTPHGSQNARLLNMPNINVLCNQCHSAVAVATIHGQGQGSSDSVPCTSCHTYIHGSNMNAAFLR